MLYFVFVFRERTVCTFITADNGIMHHVVNKRDIYVIAKVKVSFKNPHKLNIL